MTYKEARVYLDQVSKYGSVLGLESIAKLLEELGDPQDHLKFVHIAGTNGKGSVLAYTSGILSEAGYRTGRYVSPTVISEREMIQINGEMISEADYANLVSRIRKAIARMENRGERSPTVFEVETAMAFLYFYESECDIVVLETGLGGLTDATNIIRNTLVAAFTPISRDHMGILGDTLEEIAVQKAGILKSGCTAVTAVQSEEVMAVLEKQSDLRSIPLKKAMPVDASAVCADLDGQMFDYRGRKGMQISLLGRYQPGNAVLAIEIIKALEVYGYPVSEEQLRNGLAHARWPGRFSVLQKSPVVMIDGAHNPDAVKGLTESLRQYFPGKQMDFIMGVFRDKEYQVMAELIAPLAKKVYTIDLADQERSLSAESLKECLVGCGISAEQKESPEAALEELLAEAEEEDIIIACGSLSYMGRLITWTDKRRG